MNNVLLLAAVSEAATGLAVLGPELAGAAIPVARVTSIAVIA